MFRGQSGEVVSVANNDNMHIFGHENVFVKGESFFYHKTAISCPLGVDFQNTFVSKLIPKSYHTLTFFNRKMPTVGKTVAWRRVRHTAFFQIKTFTK